MSRDARGRRVPWSGDVTPRSFHVSLNGDALFPQGILYL